VQFGEARGAAGDVSLADPWAQLAFEARKTF
jgi:hypothetical protein